MNPVVLIVDDNGADIELIMLAFEESGLQAFIVTAQDGHMALEQLANCRPDLILLDINMPRIDGFELLAEIRGNRQLAGMPVIMMSSSSSAIDQARAKKLGANRYWVKPTRFSDWVALVGSLPAISAVFAAAPARPPHDGTPATPIPAAP